MEVYRELLHTLHCPFAKNFTINNRKHIIILVNWIEDRVIRELEIEDRRNLREDNTEWDSHFLKYLLLINCPYSWPSEKNDCILFLLSEAISINYEELELCSNDTGATDNDNNNNETSTVNSNKAKPTDDSISGKVDQIASTLRLHRTDQETDADEVVDRIALVEMMLYLSDLRELQDDVNSVITSVQECTANPRLNSSLGKVGR